MPNDDGSVKRNALQKLRDSFNNQMLDTEAFQNSMERSNPMLAQIREGAVQGGVMPVAGSAGMLAGSADDLAKAVGGKIMNPNMGHGAIIRDAAQPVLSEAATMAANAKPRLNPKDLMEIYKRIGVK